MPFKVKSEGQLVEVLGTHFNINSYKDEQQIKTTLLEGSVKVHAHKGFLNDDVLLKPGQQSVLAKKLTIADVDTEEAVAWKNNKFTFNSEPLELIMRQISRWYDVDIAYKGDISGKVFTGTISRYANVTQVLKMLELTNLVHFKIEERRITVMP
ncbi:fec operon regulator FecR [compost metagenome]